MGTRDCDTSRCHDFPFRLRLPVMPRAVFLPPLGAALFVPSSQTGRGWRASLRLRGIKRGLRLRGASLGERQSPGTPGQEATGNCLPGPPEPRQCRHGRTTRYGQDPPSRPGTAQADVFEKPRLFHVKQAPRSLRSVQSCRDKPGVPTPACFT